MSDEDIRKRSILKQTAAYLPAQMPETRPAYINSQDFELFQFVNACHMQHVIITHFKSDNSAHQLIYQKRTISDCYLIVRRIPRTITYRKHPRQIRTDPYLDELAGEQDLTLKKSKGGNSKENSQGEEEIANCSKEKNRF